MEKWRVGAALCSCVALLTAGLALGRYSVLKGGAVISGAGAEFSLPNELNIYAASPAGEEISLKININTVSADELTELPGVGPALAERIVEYRETNGLFESIDEIMAVRGIGESVFSKIRDYICAD